MQVVLNTIDVYRHIFYTRVSFTDGTYIWTLKGSDFMVNTRKSKELEELFNKHLDTSFEKLMD